MITTLFILLWGAFIGLLTYLIKIYYLIPVWLILGYFASLIILLVIILLHVPFIKLSKVTNRYKHYLTRSIAFFANFFILNLRIKVVGKENVPNDGKLTIYANHKSYVDPLLILAVINRPTTFTPKASLYKVPILKDWFEGIGCFKIDRSSTRNIAKAMIEAINTVKQEVAMTIFPEGGIKDRDEEKMVDMRAGAYKVAQKAEADMLPIRIFGTTEVKYRAPFRPTKIKIVILPVIKFEDVKHLNTTELADMVMKKINEVVE